MGPPNVPGVSCEAERQRGLVCRKPLLGGVLLVEDVVGALARDRLTETKLTGRKRVGSAYALRTG
jgi:hypothetical protein